MGFVNFFARFATVLAPQVAELDEPTPMIVFVFTALVAGVLALFIRPK